jgi:hypothetical protein
VAFIFHWPLSELDRLPLEDLVMWAELAGDRWAEANQTK